MGCRLMFNIRDPKLTTIRGDTTMIKTRASVIDDTPMTTVFPYYGTEFSGTDENGHHYDGAQGGFFCLNFMNKLTMVVEHALPELPPSCGAPGQSQ